MNDIIMDTRTKYIVNIFLNKVKAIERHYCQACQQCENKENLILNHISVFKENKRYWTEENKRYWTEIALMDLACKSNKISSHEEDILNYLIDNKIIFKTILEHEI